MKKLLASIGSLFKKLFDKEYDFLRRNSALAVKVTQGLKSVVESPVLDVLTAIYPGDADDKILARARPLIDRVALEMALFHGIIQQSSGNAQVWDAVIKHLQAMTSDARVGFWMEFSARANMAMSDGKVTLSEAAILAQMAYNELYPKR